MASLDLQYDLANYTPADSAPVEANFNRIQQYVNTEVITRDGVTAMTGQLQLIGAPVNALDAVPKQYVDSFVPVGAMMMYAGAAAPAGGTWALCNGAALQQTDYPALFAVIGQTYGGTAGNFLLPNLNGRFPLGAGTDALASTGGSRDQAVVTHTHSVDHTHPGNTTGGDLVPHVHPGINHLHAYSGTTSSQDRDHSHYMRGTPTSSSAGGLGEGNVADIGNGGFPPAFTTSGASDGHLHTYSGTTGGVDRDITTGTPTGVHQHGTPALTFSGQSGVPAGSVAATNTNMPPYVSINYIIRVA